MLKLDPNYAPGYINLGTLYFHLRQFTKAEELYRRATETDPGYVLAFFDLGNVLDELERHDESIAAYVRLDKAGPWSEHARTQIRKLLDREKLSIASRTDGFIPQRRGTAALKLI